MSYSRRFNFFEKVAVDVEKKERAFQDLPVTCVTSGGGFLWLGDVDGFMHCLDSTFLFGSFRAHNAGPVRLCRQVPGSMPYLLLTVGVSVDDIGSVTGPEERLCVWNMKKWSPASKNSCPTCCRSVKTNMLTNTTFSGVAAASLVSLGEVVCLEVASTMDIIFLGHASGAVQLIKGDITSDRHCRRLILCEFAGPVTGLHYIPATPAPTNVKRQKGNFEEFWRHPGRRRFEHTLPDSDSGSISSTSSPSTSDSSSGAHLYAASGNKLVCIRFGKRDEPVRTKVLENFGCQPNCSCLLVDPEKPGRKNLVMAHKEAVYFYDAEGRGPCLAIEGNKCALSVYKNYLVSIRHNKPRETQSNFPDAHSSVTLFEYRNKFIGGDLTIPWAHSIITGFGGLFVLCVKERSQVHIVELVEKDTQSMLDILFARKSFNLALGIAESGNYSEEELAHIHRRYADHLFSQKQYDLAVQEYIQTIGIVEASYVVLRFLESGLITHLILYLETLHKPENATRAHLTKDHTALLLNCYARIDDKERIDAFLDKLASRSIVGFDFYPCINVLRRAGYFKQALRLAELTDSHAECIEILTEDLKDAGAALKKITSLPFDQALKAVCAHGSFLMTNAPSETAELLDNLCSNPQGGQISAQHFVQIFVNNRLALMKFLERYLQKDHPKDACLGNMVETLLELLLHEANEIASTVSSKDKDAQLAHLHGLIMHILEDPKLPYDESKALVLCKQRNFFPGCLYIWMKNKQYDQIMEHYVLEDNFEAIMTACEEYGDEVPSLWFEAFKYVADKPHLGDKLPGILSKIETYNLASPLDVVRMLTSSDAEKCHTLGSIKPYLLHYLESGKAKMEANEAEMQRLREETLRNREIARQSKTRMKIFQQQKCAVCSQALEPPSIHFLCDHSYHKSCFDTYASDDHLCPECSPLIRRGMMERDKTLLQPLTGNSMVLLDELEKSLNVEKADFATALSRAIAQGVASSGSLPPRSPYTAQPQQRLPSGPRSPSLPSTSTPKNPFGDVPTGRSLSSVESGIKASVQSETHRSPKHPIVSTVDSGIVTSASRPSRPLNPFDANVDGDDDKPNATKPADSHDISYPQHLNPF